MRFNFMAYPSVKMKGETMSDQQPIASLQNLRSKGVDPPSIPRNVDQLTKDTAIRHLSGYSLLILWTYLASQSMAGEKRYTVCVVKEYYPTYTPIMQKHAHLFYCRRHTQ